ncbi:chemotaxis protein CheW [Natrarchaeobius chitinivorans]|uniref:Chemotaxis protein CheW n=1 Tax=Natrarchaeobius chitinivorans TaxID=1679083 RepID=A0A3N6MF95_NATCH|nr:chemotaxis protein CheW [Natrarchaeobius chitinivorans]RQG92566.1 chemotaxis protein CheW [Natrarchaeobius chitinivorans]
MTAPSSRDGSDADADRATVLTFSLAETRYCVRVDAVASALGVGDTSSIDAADDPWNAGATTVDDERIRVVDLRRVFEPTARLPDRSETPQLLVLTESDERGRRYGWLVDDVDTTRTIRTADIAPARTSARFVEGKLEVDGDDVTWLDESEMHNYSSH